MGGFVLGFGSRSISGRIRAQQRQHSLQPMQSSTPTGVAPDGMRALITAEKAAARKKARYALSRAALYTNTAVPLDEEWASTLTTSPSPSSTSGKLTWMPTTLFDTINPYLQRFVVNAREITAWRSFHPRIQTLTHCTSSLLSATSSGTAAPPSSVSASAFDPPGAEETPEPAAVASDMNTLDTLDDTANTLLTFSTHPPQQDTSSSRTPRGAAKVAGPHPSLTADAHERTEGRPSPTHTHLPPHSPYLRAARLQKQGFTMILSRKVHIEGRVVARLHMLTPRRIVHSPPFPCLPPRTNR